MTELKVRRMAFHFNEDTPFQWNPANPMFGFTCNSLSFIAPAFERYMVAAVHQAMPHIDDPELAEEADAFLRQEALHARAHRHHVAALTAQYPGLAEVSAELDRRFDHLIKTKSLEYHLSYAADIEATFTPSFNVWLSNRGTLFDNGDHRVAPLFLWHLVEEIEHRSSAFAIYNAVVTDPWYRLRALPSVFTHMLGCHTVVCRGIDQHVPFADRGAPATDIALGVPELRSKLARLVDHRRARDTVKYPSPFSTVPRNQILRMIWRLGWAQHPHHSPRDDEVPPFADEWMTEYDLGRDNVNWYDDPSVAAD